MTEHLNQPPAGLSRTAIYVAAGRAVGAREKDVNVRNPDYLAEKLLGDLPELRLDHPVVRALDLDYETAMQDIEVVINVRMMIVRTRFIDEALERAITAGATQVMILGAGFDTHAYRFQDLLAQARVFEVDRPALQALKRQRVNDVLGGPPANLNYVEIDFQHEALPDVLARHGYDPSRKTFFILEGVTMYLTEESLRTTFGFIATHATGSTVVFDFVYQSMVDILNQIDTNTVHPLARASIERFRDLVRDEPWQFGFPPEEERDYLRELGLQVQEILPIDGEAYRRYLTRTDGSMLGAEAIAALKARMKPDNQVNETSSEKFQERINKMQRYMAYQLAEAVV